MTEPLSPIEAVLAASLDTGSVRDVCFYAFSRRTKSDGVIKMHHPLPVVAVGSILEKTPGFADLLGAASAECGVASGEALSSQVRCYSIRQAALGSEYEYDSDSDLDDEEQKKDCLSDDDAPSEDTFDISTIGTEDPEAEEVKVHPQPVGKYRNVMLSHVAFRTLRVGIFFVYTGKVRFLPLRSQGFDKRQSELRVLESSGIPACSPKSLYRFANAFDMKDLRERAANAITHRLSPENIVDEVFSSFFCRYEDLHKRAVSIVGLLYDNPAVQQSLQRLIPRLVKGELPHAGPTLVALFQMQKVDPPHRLARFANETATQSVSSTYDDSSPFGAGLNASAQSFRPKRPPLAAPDLRSGVIDTSAAKPGRIPASPIVRPTRPVPRSHVWYIAAPKQ